MREIKGPNGGRKKRKTETNYVDPYDGPSTLPPPPTMRDATAVPAKLRKIMQMKSSLQIRMVQKKQAKGTGHAGPVARDLRDWRSSIKGEQNGEDSASIVAKGKSNRRQRREEELSTLIEKMDRRNKTGTKVGVAPRRKSFLEAKKKRRDQQKAMESDPLLDFQQPDNVKFGEVVQAPPKLSLPAKAAEVKKKEESRRNNSAFNEKSRLQAIEAYRQQKAWSSRPGGARLPTFDLTDASR